MPHLQAQERDRPRPLPTHKRENTGKKPKKTEPKNPDHNTFYTVNQKAQMETKGREGDMSRAGDKKDTKVLS